MAVSALTITTAGSRYVQDFLPKDESIDVQRLILLLYILVPLAIWAVVVFFLYPLMLERRLFRRLVLGRRYVEGYWIERFQNSTACGYSIIRIEPNKESFALGGRVYDAEGNLENTFKEEFHQFLWPTLTYCYTNTPRPDGAHLVEGIALHNFSLLRNGGKSYDGYVLNAGEKERFITYGQRLTRSEAALVRTRQGILQLIREFETQIAKAPGAS